MRLFIAEKPSLAVAILNGLGGDEKRDKKNGYYQIGDDVVTYCYGHLLTTKKWRDLDPEKYKYWDLENLPMKTIYPPVYKPIPESEKQLKIVLNLISKCQEIVNAGDIDASGCALVNEVIEYSGFYLKDKDNINKVKRVLIVDMNIEPVKKALNDLRDNRDFENLSNSEVARMCGDLTFGYNLTEVYSLASRRLGYIGNLSIGRVISVILGFVNERTLANQGHKKTYYYEINGKYLSDNSSAIFKFLPEKDSEHLNEKKHFISEDAANEIKNECNGASFVVESITTKEEIKQPPNPFSLSSLQIVSAKKWGYNAQVVLDALQNLYLKLLVTYPRSDSTSFPLTIYSDAQKIIQNIKDTCPDISESCENADLSIQHKAFNDLDSSAHHAIAPSLKKVDIESLDEKEKNIYLEIVKNFINLFHLPSKREKTKVTLKKDNVTFVSNQTTLTFAGWENKKENVIDESKLELSTLTKGEEVIISDIEVAKKETVPPKYFVESTLLSAMTKAAKFIKDPELRKILEAKDIDNKNESGSIGTEATRAGLLEKCRENTDLFELEKVKGYKELVWKTTKQGQELAKMLPDEITMPDTSALWEEKLALIRDGKLSVEDFISYIDKDIAERVNHVKKHGVEITRNTIPCPKCNLGLIRFRSAKTKKYGWRCDGYPDCKEIFNDVGGKPQLEKKKAVISDHKCTECNKGLIKRRSKGKSFWACSGYPDCTQTFPDIGNKPKYKNR